jgi:hypothetical protein
LLKITPQSPIFQKPKFQFLQEQKSDPFGRFDLEASFAKNLLSIRTDSHGHDIKVKNAQNALGNLGNNAGEE